MAFASFFEALSVKINRHEIRRMVLFAADEIRKLLTLKMKNRMICLMYDGAKRQNKSIFGVKAQYIEGNEMKVVGLGALIIAERHSSEHFADQLKILLDSFVTSVDNLYAITSDTASTMLKTSRLLKEAQNHFFTFEIFLDDVPDADNNDESLICDPLFNDDLPLDNVDDDDFRLEGHSNIRYTGVDEVEVNPPYSMYFAHDEGSIASIVGCCAHICQLCAHDVSKNFEGELNSVRAFVKECKKASYKLTAISMDGWSKLGLC